MILKPRRNRCIVRCGARIGPCGEHLAGLEGNRALGAIELLNDGRVVLDVDNHGDIAVVLRCGPDHGGAANVDVLDGLLERSLAGDGFLERIEIAHEEIDSLDPVFLH